MHAKARTTRLSRRLLVRAAAKATSRHVLLEAVAAMEAFGVETVERATHVPRLVRILVDQLPDIAAEIECTVFINATGERPGWHHPQRSAAAATLHAG